MDIVKGNMGWIEVIVGPMFSGKSEELIRRLKRAEIARQRVQIFKPMIDSRYSHTEIVSHSGFELPSEIVANAVEMFEKVQPRTEVVGRWSSRAVSAPSIRSRSAGPMIVRRVENAAAFTSTLRRIGRPPS